jgi:hypothetical protein
MNEFSKDTFQVINMNYKLKRIKNKKQRNNYKNIPVLETLDNTPKLDTESSRLEPFNTTPVQKTETSSFQKPVEGFTDADYDGLDNVNDDRDSADGTDPREKIISLINFLYKKANALNDIIARRLAMALSNNTAQDSDIKLIRDHMVWTEAAIMASFVSYNLFFIMYYKDVEKVHLFDISREKVKEAAINNQILYLVLFFFEYSIFFPEILNKAITEIIPKFARQFFNATFVFVIIFILLVFFFKYSGAFFKDFLINGIAGNVGWIGYGCMGVVLALWLKTFMEDANKMFYEVPEKTGIFPDKVGVIFFFINRFLRLMAAMTFGVPMGIFLMMLYIIVYVFLAVFIYKGFNTRIYSQMDEYIKNTKGEYIPGICENPTIWDYIYKYFGIELLMKFFDSLNIFIQPLAFIIIFASGIGTYLTPGILKGKDPLQGALVGINGGLILFLLILVAKKAKDMFGS